MESTIFKKTLSRSRINLSQFLQFKKKNISPNGINYLKKTLSRSRINLSQFLQFKKKIFVNFQCLILENCEKALSNLLLQFVKIKM